VEGEMLMARWNCHSWIQARIEAGLLWGPRIGMVGGGGVGLRGGRRFGSDIVVFWLGALLMNSLFDVARRGRWFVRTDECNFLRNCIVDINL